MPSLSDPEIDPIVDPLPPALEAAIRAELEPDEKVIWIGRPLAWAMSQVDWSGFGYGLFMVPFSIIWICFANTTPKGGNPGFGWFGIPFFLVGLFQASIPLRAWHRGRRTAYVVTDARAIVIRPGATFGRSLDVFSFPPIVLREMHRNERRDGSGDLVFREVPIPSYHQQGARVERRGFLGVAAVHEVERLIRKTLAIG